MAVAAGGLILAATFLVTWIRRRASRAGRDAARHLAQSESRLHDLANSSSDLLFRLTPDGTTIFASLASAQLLGRTAEQLLGSDLLSLVVAETAPNAKTRLQTLIADGEPRSFLARTTGAGGVRRLVECSLRLGRSADVDEVWGSLQDITDRRSASDQVAQLFQLSEDFMAVVNFDGLLVQTNPVWTAAFELSKEHLLGTRFEQLFQPDDHEPVTAELARLAASSSVATFETRYLRGDVARTLLWTAAPDPDRRLIYAVGRDITDHKELQRALAKTRDQALEASRLKSEFVATMSHEIRTPMNGVIGLTDLLLSTTLDATQRRYVEGVRIAGDALLSVINDILDFSKIEAGRLVLDSIDFRLEDVVEDVATLVRQSANAKGLELTVEFRPGVPFALNGDPGRLRQILLNLTHNAVKFTERGRVSVRVQPGPTRTDGRVPVIFEVIDTGIGMDPSRLEELFEPFRQAHEGATRAYGGTGLGLSICRRLADLMGGEIHASSDLGRGATFVAELVFAPAADWGRSVRGPDARGLAVLVVDDDEVNRLVMVTQLNRWGMRPVAASSAAQALELLTRRPAPAGGYDLAVIDMHMPRTDGLALVQQLRSIPALRRLPVILLTSDETTSAELAVEFRISARLTKPVQQSDLFDALTRVAMPSAFTVTPSANARTTIGPATDDPVAVGPVEDGPADASPSKTTAHTHPDSARDSLIRSPIIAPRSGSHLIPPSGADFPFQLLLVEDNDINQTVALGILTQLGYQVDVAGDGIQAVTMAGQHAYDAILMDCQMPRLDGYAATVQLRKRAATRSTPIIAMTAATFAADRQRCFDSGMDDFIAKPVRAATLQATLNRWLRPDPPSVAPEKLVLETADPPTLPVAANTETTPPRPRTPVVYGPAPAPPARVPAAPDAGFSTQAGDGDGEAIGTEQRIQELLGDRSQLEIDMVRDIISSFLSRTVDLLQRLTLAVAANDAASAHLHAHSMAGAGLNLGTVEVVKISRQIEADAKTGRPALSVPRLVELEVALDRARIILRDLAVNLPGAEPFPDPLADQSLTPP
jgi:two-component system, sensor histidine kinase and response regulator